MNKHDLKIVDSSLIGAGGGGDSTHHRVQIEFVQLFSMLSLRATVFPLSLALSLSALSSFFCLPLLECSLHVSHSRIHSCHVQILKPGRNVDVILLPQSTDY